MIKAASACVFAIIFVFFTTLSISATPNVDIVDSTFNAQIQTTTFRPKIVKHLITMPDGKILASGNFNTYNGVPVGSLIRLNADASLDTTFDNNLMETETYPASITLQSDGKILLEGTFTLTNGTIYTKTIIRLNVDGTIDSSFNYPYGGNIYEVRTDANGGILVSGYIRVIENGATVYKDIIRLNNDGTINLSVIAAPLSHCINRFTTQNNKILYTCGDIAAQQSRLYRLNEDGTNDNSFTPTLVGNAQILEMRAQPDNRILILSDHRIFRINENGGADADFQITTSFSPGQPRKINLQNDGRITIMYSTSSPYGMRIIRLLSNGTFDPSFVPYNYLDSDIQGHTVQVDGGVLIGDQSTFTNRFIRLLPSGSVDTSFNPGGSGFQNINPGKIRAITVLANEKILIGGDFDKVNNIDRTRIARVNTDSTLDPTFQVNTSGTGNYFSQITDIYHFAVQNDGKIIVSGGFSYFINGVQKYNLVRLNPDGSIDSAFNLSLYIADNFLTSQMGKNKPLQMTDGKILVGTSRAGLADTISIPLLLNASGVKDTTFNPTIHNTKTSVVIFDIALQPNGKILIAGKHVIGDVTGNIQRGFIARLNSDGTIDQSFQAPELVNRDVFAFTILPNNQILIVSKTNTTSAVSRLNSDGTQDNSFNTGLGANGAINAITVLPNNKILVGGAFTSFNNQSRQNLAMLNADGTLAASLGTVNREVLCITVDSQGRVLIGGSFTSIGSGTQNSNEAQNSILSDNSTQQVTRSYLARLIVSAQTTRTYFDFDGDGKSDISVFRPSSGTWYLQQSQNGFSGLQFGSSADRVVPADYDGDGKTDIAVYRGGVWYLQRSAQGFTGVAFGAADDIPVPADYDGDGRSDIAVFRQSTGVWYLQRSNLGFAGIAFGQAGDKPVAADYDGDGRADIAVFRSGTWYIQRSGLEFTGVAFGESTDKPVAADYDGDGKADIAVFRPSNGTWYILQSQLGFTGAAFGISTDKPVPADYDGDGKSDIAVFRDGTWYIQRSTQGLTNVAFGTATDQPVPNAFVP